MSRTSILYKLNSILHSEIEREGFDPHQEERSLLERIRERIGVLLGLLFILAGALILVFPDRTGWFTPGWLPISHGFGSAIGVAEMLCGVGLLSARTRRAAGISLILILFASWCTALYLVFSPPHVASESKGSSLAGESLAAQWELAVHGENAWEDLASLPRLEFPPEAPHTMRVRIMKITKDRVPWHIQLNRWDVSVLQHRRYALRFRARAGGRRPMRVGVGRAHGDWGSLGLYGEVSLTEEWQQFAFAFNATESDAKAHVWFDLGEDAQQVELADVVLLAQDALAMQTSGTAADAPVGSTIDAAPAAAATGQHSAAHTHLAGWHMWWEPVWILLLVWCSGSLRSASVFARQMTWGLAWQSTSWCAGLIAGWVTTIPWVSQRPLGDALLLCGLGAMIGSVAFGGLATIMQRWTMVLQDAQRLQFLKSSWLVTMLGTVGLLAGWHLPRAGLIIAGLPVLALGVLLLLYGRRQVLARIAADYHALPRGVRRVMHARWDANSVFWGMFIGFVLCCHVWLVYHSAQAGLMDLLFIAANRLLIYTVLVGTLALFLRVARTVTPKLIFHAYTVLLGTLPLICALDYLVTNQTARPLLGWIDTLFAGETLATAVFQVEHLLQWGEFPIMRVAALLLGTIIITLVLMRVTAPFSRWLGQAWSNGRVVAALGLCVILGVTSDVFGPRVLTKATWGQMRQISYFWFLSPPPFEESSNSDSSLIAVRFAHPPGAQAMDKLLTDVTPLQHKPDIFLIVLETLRLDAVTPEVAPRLSAFRSQCQSADRMFAGSMGSDLSWFTIFHGYHALHWRQFSEYPRPGSYPLRLLKHLGYQIQTRLAGSFRWKGLDEMVFGANHRLADVFLDSRDLLNMQIYDRDRLLMNDLLQDLSTTVPGGHMYIHEIDSAHWNYGWPTDFQVPYREYAPSVDLTKVSYTPDEVQLVKNRYLNTVHWVDHLFGKLEDHLKRTGRFDDSIIIVVGDHGEELYEDGRWAHGTRLSWQQTETPVFVKLPGRLGTYPHRHFLSQVDVMPTIFMALGVDPRFYGFLEGISIDRPRETLLVSSLQASSGWPGLVFMHPKMKVQLGYWSQHGLTGPDRMRVLGYVDFRDRSLVPEKRPGQTDADFLREHFPELLDQLFVSFAPVASRQTMR